MVFIDVHAHLDYSESVAGKVERAKEAGVEIIVSNGTDKKSNRRVIEIIGEFDEVKAALGVYPIDALKMDPEELNEEIEFIREHEDDIVAIGEVGIDLKENKDLEKQTENFKRFIDLAMDLDKPIIVHSRKAEKEVIKMLEESGIKKVVMHCFSGKSSLVNRIVRNGWMLSVPTNVVYSDQMRGLVKRVPIAQILCETDSPFMHPEKKRNNEPKNVIEGYKVIAEIKEMKLEDVEEQVEENYESMFS